MSDRIARSPVQIGALIVQARAQRGETQVELGRRMGMRQATISSLEQGRDGTRLSTLFDVLAALDLELVLQPRAKAQDATIETLF